MTGRLEKALRELQVPMFNIVYGDRQGHILYIDNGILPKHPGGGDFAT
jgi:acyl-homoserine-lactone acylase